MATALDLIKRSLRLIHVLDADETPTAAEAQDALAALNDVLDSLTIDRSYVYNIREDTLSWPSGSQSRTIGPTGDFALTRPVRLANSTFYTDNAIDYVLNIAATRRAYTAIADKAVQSNHPQHIFYEPTFPDGTLYIWPTPNATLELNLHSWQQLTQIAALTTTLSFPPGYKHALTTSLSEELGAEFGVAVPPEVTKAAFKARQRLKSMNTPVMRSQVEVGYFRTGHGFNVFSGD